MKNKLTHIICVCLVLIMALQTLILPSFAALLSDEDFLNEFPALKEPVADNTTVSGLNLNPYQQSLTPEDLGVYAPTDRVSAIVKLSGESVLSLAQKAGVSVAD